MLPILAPLRELTIVSIVFRFLLATACGAVIGYERGKKRHAAGLRTHIVVCIGAASVMILSQYLAVLTGSNGDPAGWAPRSSAALVFWAQAPSSSPATSGASMSGA